MKPLAEQTHYEVLELEPGASEADVERAYRMALATYAGSNLATYSVFDQSDAEVIRHRVELAYEVLSDADTRRRYDAELGESGRPTAPRRTPLAPFAEPGPEVAPDGVAEAHLTLPPLPVLDFEDDEEEQSGGFDGARLRRARLRRGVEIEQIAAITKINSTYLQFIEDDRLDDLPAPVYVRGFVAAFARCLGLDGRAVAASYLERLRDRDAGDGRRPRDPA